MEKHQYKRYDLVKLVMMIYDGDYSYISHDNDFRDQFKLLAEYFKKEFGHNLITFLMIKAVLKFKGTDKYEEMTAEVANLETVLRTKKNVKAEDLCIFSYPIENEKYNDLMMNIEANPNFSYALAIVYEKIQNSLKAKN